MTVRERFSSSPGGFSSSSTVNLKAFRLVYQDPTLCQDPRWAATRESMMSFAAVFEKPSSLVRTVDGLEPRQPTAVF